MLTLSNKISELSTYKSNFSNEEKIELTRCFGEIQQYIISNYLSKDTRNHIELQLHRNSFTHSYLVINCARQEVYLSHRDHGSSINNYFCTDEGSFVGWKYTMALIVIDKWNEIKEMLKDYLCNTKSVSDLCIEFRL